jgi:hypothetical protein
MGWGRHHLCDRGRGEHPSVPRRGRRKPVT